MQEQSIKWNIKHLLFFVLFIFFVWIIVAFIVSFASSKQGIESAIFRKCLNFTLLPILLVLWHKIIVKEVF